MWKLPSKTWRAKLSIKNDIDPVGKRDRDYQGSTSLKKLDLSMLSDDTDPLLFCMLFKSSSLEKLDVALVDFNSNEQVCQFFGSFPNVESMILQSWTMVKKGRDSSHDRVKNLELRDGEDETAAKFSLITRQFPNLECLSTGQTTPIFDVTDPTRIRCLKMKGRFRTLRLSLFPYLQELTYPPSCTDFNQLIRDLQGHCPQLAKLYIEDTNFRAPIGKLIVPDFDHVTFAGLTHLKLKGPFVLNSSFLPFLARHSSLESLDAIMSIKIPTVKVN